MPTKKAKKTAKKTTTKPKAKTFDHDEIMAKAIKAQHQYESRNGYIHQQPAADLSNIEHDVVTLRNSNGILAQFKISPTGRLSRIEDTENE